jgi:hypothetical protein
LCLFRFEYVVFDRLFADSEKKIRIDAKLGGSLLISDVEKDPAYAHVSDCVLRRLYVCAVNRDHCVLV